ncbi:MAG TPA: nuclear transport factor 2 family protein [Acidimicrobiales bacterium]
MNRTATMTPEEMDRVLTDHFIAEATHDLKGLLGTLTDDVEHDVVGVADGMHHGREETGRFYKGVFARLTQEGVEPLRRYYGENFLVDEVIYTGEADGSLFGVDGRRGTISIRILHVVEFRDGRMARENTWLDVETARRQLLEADDGARAER